MFTRSDGVWSQQAYLEASNADAGDQFGASVAISGDTIVVGAIGEDSRFIGGEEDNFRHEAGAAYVFTRSDGIWSQQALLKPRIATDDDQFGTSVAISADTVVVGAPGEDSSANGGERNNSTPSAGAAYVFRRNDGIWSQQALIKASNADEDDEFGISV
ncbi:MAG: FG-GAP repeat protein, partial [Candidatus Thiodiazotropha sp. (ex Lucinoma annulata)]|nr:FG-GAP repeat protein [Candidatus Thiodiazotropha sp. (ex Lucinoma annulata)]